MESIESVNKILEEANKRIQPTGTGILLFDCLSLYILELLFLFIIIFFSALQFSGELFGALKGRLYDSNKNLIMATLSTIGAVASAMGAAVEKSSKVYILTSFICSLCYNMCYA